jgi:hypothetical protein
VSTQQFTAKLAPVMLSGGQPQTPWASVIDAANWPLANCPQIGGPSGAYLSMNGGQIFGYSTKSIGLVLDAPNAQMMTFTNNSGRLGLEAADSRLYLWPTTGVYLYSGKGAGTALRIVPDANDDTRTLMGVMTDSPAFALDVAGDVNCTGVFRIGGVPVSGGGGSQTPWAQDIDGGGYNLYRVGNISVGALTASESVTTGLLIMGDRVNVSPVVWDALNYGGVLMAARNDTSEIAFQCDPVGRFFVVDPASTGWKMGIAKAAPAYALDIVGDVNITGQYFIGGVAQASIGQLLEEVAALRQEVATLKGKL